MHNMDQRHAGLTAALAGAYTEAARVCLDRHHQSPIDVALANAELEDVAIAKWRATDRRTKSAWANEIDTTEAGAYACALAAVELTGGLVAVYRAETRTGADYYVAPAGEAVNDLENCIRFEVSGVDRGSPAAIEYRLKSKLEQARVGHSNLPAVAGVVGFKAKLIVLATLKEK